MAKKKASEDVVEEVVSEATEAKETASDIVEETSYEEQEVLDTDVSTDDHTEQHDNQQLQAERDVVRKSGFLPVFLGGVIAAGLGFVAAKSEMLDPYLPASWQAQTVDVSGLTTQIETQAAQISDLSEQLRTVVSPQLTALETKSAGVATSVSQLSEQLTDNNALAQELQKRLSELEKQPMTEAVSQSAIDAYERELQSIQASVAAQRAEIETLLSDAQAKEQNAEETAQQALARSAATRVLSAIDSGAPFVAALNDVVKATGQEAPAELAAVANDGVATLAELQTQFPTLARDALTAARAESKEPEGVASFLKRQLGARSVVPREGDDPDAVLSRAEAALREGRLTDTLAEIETLSEAARSALAGWSKQAQSRQAAQAAAEHLAQSLNNN